MKYIISVLMIFLGINTLSAQEVYSSSGRPDHAQKKKAKQEGFDPSKLIIGGGLAGLGFGNGYAFVGLSGLAGYKLTEDFSAGVELGFQYYHNANDAIEISSGGSTYVEPFNRTSSIYTTGLWARYIVWRNIFVLAKPQMLNVDNYQNFRFDNFGNVIADDSRQWIPALVLGAGIRQRISERVSGVFYLGYDVIQNPNSPYYQTLDIGVLFNVGF